MDKWTYFIKGAHKLKVIPSKTKDEGLITAYEEAEKHNWTKKEYDAYIYAGMRAQDAKGELEFARNKAIKLGEEIGEKRGEKRGEERGLKKGEAKGLKKGEKKAKTEVVIRCLKGGMKVELTAQIAGISIEEVQQIKDKFQL